MSTKFLSPGWRMPRNANQSKSSNYSLDFNGSSDISISGISAAGEFTLSAWVKGITSSTFYIFGSTNSSNWLRVQSGNAVGLKTGNGQLSDSGSLPTFTFNSTDWFHIVVTRDSSNNIQVYVNNSIDPSYTPRNGGTGANSMANPFVPNFIGQNFSQYTTGKIDAVCIFNYALSTSQITTLYGSSSTGPGNPMALPSPPIAYYPLGTSAWNGEYLAENNAIGDYVFDFNPNNVHGHINLGASTLTSDTYSLSLWFNSTSTSTQVITEKQAGTPWPYRIYLYGTGNLELLGTQTSGTVYNDGKWHNVVIVQDPSLSTGKSKGYVDGVPVTSSNSSGGVSSSNNFYIGGRNGTGYPYKGELSNFQLFDAALSATEIETLYNYGSPIRTLANIPQSSNLKAWYKLDASEVYNSSSTEWSVDNNQNPSAYPSSLDFDGIDDYIDCGTSQLLDFNSSFTISAWVYITSTASGYDAVYAFKGASNAFVMFFNNGSGYSPISFGSANYPTDGTIKCATNVTINQWNNIIVVYNGNGIATPSNYTFYINNESQTLTTSLGFSDNGNVNYIGRYAASHDFDGKISNVAIYNTALSASNVATLYNNGTPQAAIYGSPVAHWKLDNTTTGIGNGSSPYSTALNFNSTKADLDYVQFGNTSLSLPASLSIWLKPLGIQPNGYGMPYSDSSGQIYWGTGTGGMKYEVTLAGASQLNSTVILTADIGGWQHLVVTFTSTATKIYLNGELNASGSGGTGTNFGQDINIGRWKQYATNTLYGFDGSISNFAIFNSELSASQVSTLFNFGTPETNISLSPIHNWKLDNLTTGLNDTGSLASNNGTAGSVNGTGPVQESTYVSVLSGTNNGATEYAGFVNVLAGDSSGMSQSNLVQSDLQTVAPYSKYAMNFDAGNADYIDLTSQIVLTSELTISCWVKSDGAVIYGIVAADNGSADSFYRFYPAAPGGNRVDITVDGTSTEWNFANGGTPIQNGVWQHYLLKRDSNNKWTFYLDNVKYTTNQPTISGSFRVDTFCRIYSTSPRYFEGAMSNMAIWNTSLSDSQVREVYNQGLPSDLNSFSGTAPIHWWQLGEGSSYAGGWIFADEIGSINGEGQNIAETDLTNGVGTTANGVSTNMAEGNLVGDAPYSTTNAVSVNMAATARGTSVP